MLSRFVQFFRTGADQPIRELSPAALRRTYEWRRWSVFLSVTLGYGFFYVCRVNFSAAKQPMLDEGVMSATQMGLMGSAMLGAYAIGKLVNGFLADRSNVRRFMAAGLMASGVANLVLGAADVFGVFLLLWGVNGWLQSTGGAPSVVALSQWFSRREIGTRYGLWSISHSIGEGLTFLVTATVVAEFGWRSGFLVPGAAGVLVAVILLRTLADRPATYGLPPVATYKDDAPPQTATAAPIGALQREVLTNPAVWILGLGSACMYVSRYGVNNWGMVLLQEGKGYSLTDAGAVLSAYSLAGLVGSATAGLLTDLFFGSRRNVLALILGVLQAAAIAALFVIPPGHVGLDVLALVVFGYALGGLLVFLGGLMAVDISSKRAVGAAMGVIGVMSYAGAAIQDTVSGILIDQGAVARESAPCLASFAPLGVFWVVAAVASLLLVLLVWRVKPRS